MLQILFEDSDIIGVVKPAGLNTIAPEGGRGPSLYDQVTHHIQRRNPKGRAAVLHRLDRETSGVLIFGKNTRTKQVLMQHWNELVAVRRYTAVIEGSLARDKGTIESFIREESDYRMKTGDKNNGGLHSVTHYVVLARNKDYSLVELELDTGRKHQLRVQLSSEGHPILGDERYHARTDKLGRLALHAHLLIFKHPFTKEQITLEAAAPKEFLKLFRREDFLEAVQVATITSDTSDVTHTKEAPKKVTHTQLAPKKVTHVTSEAKKVTHTKNNTKQGTQSPKKSKDIQPSKNKEVRQW